MVINSTVDTSLGILNVDGGLKPTDAPRQPLKLDDQLGVFMRTYEDFVRKRIIQGVSWFGHRDAVAASVIQTVYSFFKHYGEPKRKSFDGRGEFGEEVRTLLEEFRVSIGQDEYGHDEHYEQFTKCAQPGNSKRISWAIKTMDYVASMTDNRIMDVHHMALKLFR
jgi:dGTP triphosphohydrolase